MNTVTLGSVLASLESGARPKGGVSTKGDGVPSIGGEHLDADGGFRLESIKFVPRDFFDGMTKGRIAVDDILVVKDGATTGKTSFVGPDFPFPVAAVNEHVFVVRVDCRKAWPKYAFHYLLSAQGQADIQKDFRGATVGGISRGFVDLVRLHLPSLPIQKRIAAILDAADGLRAKRRESIEQLDSLVQATFLEMFGDPVTNPKGWQVQPLGYHIQVKHGFAFQSKYFCEHGPFVLLTPGNFYEAGGYRDRGDKQKFYDGPVPDGFVLEENDLLVAMTEQAPGLLGSPLLVPEPGRYLHNQRLGKLIGPSASSKLFWCHLFNSKAIRDHIQRESTGSKVKHTSPTKIESIQCGVPPTDLRSHFSSIVESIEQQKARLKAHLAELDTLFASLQSRAFNGELVA
jgi:type I restriction enzyme, S subunit